MQFSGGLLIFHTVFFALTAAAPTTTTFIAATPSLNTNGFARDSQQSSLEPRGNTMSAVKNRLKTPSTDDSQLSSNGVKKLLIEDPVYRLQGILLPTYTHINPRESFPAMEKWPRR